MIRMANAVASRLTDFQAVLDFLTAASQRPAALSIEGEAGIGKTTLWLEAADRARTRGATVLSARAVQAESVLAYAALADLLADVDTAVFDGLHDLQRTALDRVLLRGDDGPATDQRVIAAAFVSVIDTLAARTPVVLAIDDAQWLDSSSLAVVAFAARRLKGPVGLLVTARTEHDNPNPASWLQLARPDGVDTVHVGPLSLGGLHRLVSARLGHSFPRPTMVRIAEISRGNPFFALELARAADGRPPGSEPDLPASLAELMRTRIGRLEPEAGHVLLAAACSGAPTLDLLARSIGSSVDRVIEVLETVESNGIISIEGNRVRFAHPLLARSVYTDAGRPDRRRMHRALAEIVEQPELKARHLALAAVSEDPATLQALDAAAEVARARGAPAAAAEMMEMAIRLGGDDPVRRLRAADHHFEAGDTVSATAHLDPTIGQLPSGPMLAIGLILRAGIHIYDNNFLPAADLLAQALTEATGIPKLQLRTLMLLSMAQGMGGEFDESTRNASAAVTLAEDLGRPALISQALALYVHAGLQYGHPFDEPSLRRAVDLEDLHVSAPVLFRASVVNPLALAHVGRLDEAKLQMGHARRHCEERGAEYDLMSVAGWTTLICIWRGEFAEAARHAEEAVERAQQIGGDFTLVIPLTVRAAANSYLGRIEDARADARAALDGAQRCNSLRMTEWPMMTLGFIEVSLGNYAEALTVMAPLIATFDTIPGTEIMSKAYIPEAVEAMTALGRLDEAEPLIAAMERNGRQLDRPWMLAISARCRAMVLAATGDVEGAEQLTRQALTEHDRLPMPFEKARTQLLLGQLQRRQRQKEAAATTLGDALAGFEALGSPLWAERARAELARTNVSPGGEQELTPSEQRVAELTASGMTNRDVAAALFISPKTVEHNLGRIYRKLGIKSRAELGRLMGSAQHPPPQH